MAIITVETKDKEVMELLQTLLRRVNNLTPAMKEIGQIVRSSVVKNFMVGGRPPWKPSKRAQKQKGKTLVDTGRLWKSITARAYPDRAIVGTNVVYAPVHQFGGKRGYIPARPYLLVQSEDWIEIRKALKEHLLRRH